MTRKMIRSALLGVLLGMLGGQAVAAGYTAVSLQGFDDGIKHWRNRYGDKYEKYAPEQIREIANNVLLYQRLNGGWIENRDPTRVLSYAEKAQIQEEQKIESASFDNRNVYSQIEYLAAVYGQTGEARYREALLRGLDFTLNNQHKKCGGWPHTVPGEQSYHPYITMADEVTSGVLRTLRKIAAGSAPFAFMPAATRARAGAAVKRGDACVLQLQIVQNGQLAGWAGQYHPDTLLPANGRSFELASIVSQESIEMLRYLMGIDKPTPAQIRAIEGGVKWFERSALKGLKIETVKLDQPVKYEYHTATTDRLLVEDPAAPLLWARFYDLKDNSVVLANRDGIRVAKYADIHHERRTGYAWYGQWPAKLLDSEYPAWCARLQRASVLNQK
ncbi:pectate lyase [Uliginosibacterium sp. 31-12]|uniref:pectate lyase n=1 Tax=Uliginosibacterium sp. 31-12 TaxID=3062781 RepID=UPI0026E3EF5D|nr:pectate lyase [Uliginosibacterium sp. 31-12]MDO6385902.1 pectate lyase [Uliginosibacterium sp. 31-12]